MDAVTYPDQTVIEFLNKHFVMHKVNVEDRSADARQLLRTYRQLWEPGLVVIDYHGVELRRWVGFLPPREFMAELSLGLGKAAMLHGQYPDAHVHFLHARQQSTPGGVAPEATYWACIAAYREGGRKKAQLGDCWATLKAEFPESSWWSRADVFRE